MAQSFTTPPNLPDPNRVITDTNSDAKAVFADIPAPLTVVRNLNGSLVRLGYVTDRPPVSYANNMDVATYEQCLQNLPPLVQPGGGAVVWYIDTPPNGASPLHRTVSLDIVIPVEGEIELQLDSGETRLLKPGDLAIQRATMHAWRNPSTTKWARMIGIMSESEPVVVGNQTLGPSFPS
ncbi:uncharacterized protein BCR38DRAFT_452998 [Pseudomassariella vexata]|uniref:Cupin 2 conserved barrel domain-containing protein n=1 Tax=Pseudomassariella vexata TaxID=1141098 RepID=A0A1Y2D6M3_9PEZI|nr:uncharacterized protein BCR38DRAFT_452998 [Pseudomassariella vexata]ORY54951.1 hypothetical protein BCR38DRAFT_452998 [Pseudomassariella vexata]